MINIGLIPARGGSKGIKNKNIVLLNGKPLIAYTIQAALESRKLHRIIVSTDSPEIAQVAKEHGAEVPFLRPPEISGDSISDFPVIKHLISWITNCDSNPCSSISYLRPTTPFKKAEMIDREIEMLDAHPEYSAVRSVSYVEGPHHPYWMYKINEQGVLSSFVEGVDIKKYYQRQLLPSCVRLNGVVDTLRANNVVRDLGYGGHIAPLLISNQFSFDIDNEIDLKICEAILTCADS